MSPTDIEGSKALWERDREPSRLAGGDHDRLLRQTLEGAGGSNVMRTVAGRWRPVRRARPRISAALSIQREVSAHHSDSDVRLRERMGVNAGAAAPVDGDHSAVPDVTSDELGSAFPHMGLNEPVRTVVSAGDRSLWTACHGHEPGHRRKEPAGLIEPVQLRVPAQGQ